MRFRKLSGQIAADVGEIQARRVFRRPFISGGLFGDSNVIAVRPFDNLLAVDVDFVGIAEPCGL